ncbi:hypothetical protein JXB12_11340 [candidate division KSB1 bacterium]|nr:hypothetical protein [candidate division KSB1 bacterium]
MFKKIVALSLLVCFLFIIGCAAHVHTIGKGPQMFQKETARQWYILWGLVPLNEVNTNTLAEGAENYEIRTEACGLDILMNIFTSYVTVTSRTVTITK